MPRDLEHLQLPEWNKAEPRRKRGGGQGFTRKDKDEHAKKLLQEVDLVSNHLQERKQRAPQGINPKLVFKIKLNEKGNLDETQLRQMGLRLLARNAKRAFVVFPDDATLNEVRKRLREFAGLEPQPHKYEYLNGIDEISELTPGDRIGIKLKNNPLGPNEIASLDIELWHSGEKKECKQRIDEIQNLLDTLNLKVTDKWIGESICLIRAKVNAAALSELLTIDYIKEIERRPNPNFELLDLSSLGPSDFAISQDIPENSTGILIIDSGIMQRHPILGPSIGDAQIFPDRNRVKIEGGPEDGDKTDGGHGTAVAGIAAYYDVGECLKKREFKSTIRLFSARVTDEKNDYDEDELLEHQLEEAIEYFLLHYSSIRVINISLGNWNLYYKDDEYQFRFAAAIDEIAYRYRDKNILFVVSSGNFKPDLNSEELYQNYPQYLLDFPEARLIDPATSALSVTVGGLAYGEAKSTSPNQEKDTGHGVAGQPGFPSPFTRTGWGVDGSVKPDLVDFAGDLYFDHGRINNEPEVGIPTTNKYFAPPNGRLFRSVVGTSFSTPRVANIAARLFTEFPDASSNLIRALLADSARIPQIRPETLMDRSASDDDILRIYGYGQPDYDRSRRSAQNEVLLVADESIGVDQFKIFTIPPLPSQFFETKGDRFISVTLAFDPPTRHTRGDSYLGVTMESYLYRNVAAQDIHGALANWNRDEEENLESETALPTITELGKSKGMPVKVDLKPGIMRRKKGTLQRGVAQIKLSNWKYDCSDLVLAVICQRKWAPPEITDQRFSVVVSIGHADPNLNLYSDVRQHAQLYQRVRIQL